MKLQTRSVEPGFDIVFRDPQHLRDLACRQPFHLAKKDDRAVWRRQPFQRATEPAPQHGVVGERLRIATRMRKFLFEATVPPGQDLVE